MLVSGGGELALQANLQSHTNDGAVAVLTSGPVALVLDLEQVLAHFTHGHKVQSLSAATELAGSL